VGVATRRRLVRARTALRAAVPARPRLTHARRFVGADLEIETRFGGLPLVELGDRAVVRLVELTPRVVAPSAERAPLVERLGRGPAFVDHAMHRDLRARTVLPREAVDVDGALGECRLD